MPRSGIAQDFGIIRWWVAKGLVKRSSETGFDQACWERTAAALTVYVLTGPSEKRLAWSVRTGTATEKV